MGSLYQLKDILVNEWYNFKKEKYVNFNSMPSNPEEYIPQTPPCLGMFRCCIKIGNSPQEAMMKVLDACCNRKNQ
jgi:hypothetical protein